MEQASHFFLLKGFQTAELINRQPAAITGDGFTELCELKVAEDIA